jgi:Co/Zn/Cd efflux system component
MEALVRAHFTALDGFLSFLRLADRPKGSTSAGVGMRSEKPLRGVLLHFLADYTAMALAILVAILLTFRVWNPRTA